MALPKIRLVSTHNNNRRHIQPRKALSPSAQKDLHPLPNSSEISLGKVYSSRVIGEDHICGSIHYMRHESPDRRVTIVVASGRRDQ